MKTPFFDIIIIGGGHAGTEAALASARMGVSTLLITHQKDTLGEISCNPSIGGIGKGHLVKEIDALGGAMAHAADLAGIHFRILNASKGPAVRATRAQIDRTLYKKVIREILEQKKNLTILEGAVGELIIKNNRIEGIILENGESFLAKAVVLCAGTFLNGKIHIGKENFAGGRIHDAPVLKLAKQLRELPLRVNRLKTGTPPRILKTSIDYSKLEIQPGDLPTPIFSFLGDANEHPKQIPCHIAHTNEKTHDIIRSHLKESALYGGMIEGIGPRYCPSIEDKIVRFSNRASHQIFIEPEGLESDLIYPNGISTSLPLSVQIQFVQSMEGFEKAEITRAGYAIEYDFFDPRDLKLSLESKIIHGLFFAGQVNGTTGYEEAAAQGLIAGLNAARLVQEKEPWSPLREEAYIGVMIDDLITRGTNEPYRMFTSRAEYRLVLREDNADLRLTEIGHTLGLVDHGRFKYFEKKKIAIANEKKYLQIKWISPQNALSKKVAEILKQPLSREQTLFELLKRPNITYATLKSISALGLSVEDEKVAEQLEIEAKYAGYIERQQFDIEQQLKHEHIRIPENFDYDRVKSLSNEVRQKLKLQKPETLGIASRIPGMTPAAISVLMIYLKRMG